MKRQNSAARMKVNKEFQDQLVSTLKKLNLSDGEAAGIIQVSIPTVTRWRTGEAAPHPLGRESVFKTLEDYENGIRTNRQI